MKTKKERAQFILDTLERLYPNPEIPLTHSDPFTLLVAVVLSAQCTDQRVNSITPKLFARAPTPEIMAQMDVEEVGELIRSCGLWRAKARALIELSKKIVEEFGGVVPSSFKALESLPGVGHKTASVVRIQAFGLPAFPVDTHIHRCAARWGLSKGKNVVETEKDLKALFPKEKWTKLHLQIIYFAREHCPARNHKVDKCPICLALKFT